MPDALGDALGGAAMLLLRGVGYVERVEERQMTVLEFIASLPHGEAKAAALTVHNLMSPKWIKLTDDPATWPPIGVVVVAKSNSPRYSVQLLCVEELNADWPASHIWWKVPHNIYEDSPDSTSYQCSSAYAGDITHWRPI